MLKHWTKIVLATILLTILGLGGCVTTDSRTSDQNESPFPK